MTSYAGDTQVYISAPAASMPSTSTTIQAFVECRPIERVDTITCCKKLTGSQLSPPRNKQKNKCMHVLQPTADECWENAVIVARYKTTTRQAFNYRAVLAVRTNPSFYDGVEPRRPNRRSAEHGNHVASLCRSGHASFSCFCQLRLVRSSLTSEAAKTLVYAFVSSRPDYCNCLLYGVSNCLLKKLQAVQNSAARVLSRLVPGSSTT